MPFQREIYADPAPAVEGDFASSNPRASVLSAVAAGLVVGDANVRVGYFAWAAKDGKVYSSKAAADAIGGSVIGFVARIPNEPSALITAYLGESIMTLQVGLPVTLQSAGDYWLALPGASVNDLVYALEATGAPSLVDDGTTSPSGYAAASPVPVDAVTAAAGAAIAVTTGIITLGAPASGVYEVGQRVTGVGVPFGTRILKQLTGAAGLAGTYQTNSYNRAVVAAFTATLKQGQLVKVSKAAA